MDYIGNKYETKILFDKYEIDNDALSRLSHSRQDCDNCKREEVKQDKSLYYLNFTIHAIANIESNNRFKGNKYKRINYIYCGNLRIKSPNKFIDIFLNTMCNQETFTLCQLCKV